MKRTAHEMLFICLFSIMFMNSLNASPELRQQFISGPVPVSESSMSSWSTLFRGFMSSWPRHDKSGAAAPRHLTYDDIRALQAKPAVSPYMEGVALNSAIILVIAVLTLVVGIVFCFCRFCCNCCGRRRRTTKYKLSRVWCARVCVLINSVALILIAVIGQTGDVGMTFTIDHAEYAALNALDNVFQLKDIADDGVSYVDRILDSAGLVNSTIMDAIPSIEELELRKTCLNNVFSISDSAKDVRSKLLQLDGIVKGLPDLGGVNSTLGQLKDSVRALPDLIALAQQIEMLNSSIAKMPKLDPITSDLTELNRTMGEFSVINDVSSQIKDLQATLAPFSTVPMTTKLNGFDSFWAQLPNLTRLAVDVNLVDGQAFRNVNETYADLVQMQNALNSLPSIDGFVSDIRSLNSTKNSIADSLVLIESIKALNKSLKGIPDLGRVLTSLSGFKSFLSTDFGLDAIKLRVQQSNASIHMQPEPSILLNYMKAMNASVFSMKQVNFGGLVSSIHQFNSSLNSIECIGGVIDMIKRINDTLVTLPPAINPVFDMWRDMQPMIGNISSQQSGLKDGVDAIVKMNSTLDDLPDFKSIIDQIKKMNDSSSDMPDLNKVYKQVSDLNDTLASLPNMETYINSTRKLNNSMSGVSLDDTVKSLEDMKGQLNTMPDLNPHISNMIKLNSTLSEIRGPLSGVISFLSPRPPNAPSGYSLVGPPLSAGVTKLADTKNTRPDNTPLIANLNNLNNSISTMPNMDKTNADLASLNKSLSTFPDIGSLKRQIASLQTSLANQPDFNSLSTQLRSLNKTVLGLPDLGATQKQVLDVKKSADGANIGATVKQLNMVADMSFDRGVVSQLDTIVNMRSKLDLGSYFQTIRDQRDMIHEKSDSLDTQHDKYAEQVSDYATMGRNYDGFRIGALSVFLLLPFVVSLLGICSCICRCGCGAMCMALIFIYMSFFYYLLAFALMTPATLIVDQCQAFDELVLGAIDANLPADRSIGSMVAAMNGTVLDGPINDVVTYYLVCDETTPAPPLVMNLSTYVNELVFDKFSVVALVDKIENPADGSQSIKLAPNIKTVIFSLDATVQSGRNLVLQVVAFLTCGHWHSIYNNLRSLLCTDVRDSLVILSWSFFLLGLTMSTGVCCGIMGFKRLQKQSRIVPYPGAPDDDETAGVANSTPGVATTSTKK